MLTLQLRGAQGAESATIKVSTSGSMDSTVLLRQLQHQLQEQQQLRERGGKEGTANLETASIGCQTRQADSWRMQSTGCQGSPRDGAQARVQHGMLASARTLHGQTGDRGQRETPGGDICGGGELGRSASLGTRGVQMAKKQLPLANLTAR